MSPNGMSIRQTSFVAALAQGRTGLEAARIAGISERQARRWMTLPEVQAAIARVRDELLEQATARAVGYCVNALDTLNDLVNDSEVLASARVAASRAILDTALRYSEVLGLAERVVKLETALDLSKATDDQLERLARGESPNEVLRG